MNISAPFIRRPVGTALLTIAVALAGMVAYLQLPVAPLPQVDFPTISVQAALPGASPEIMASSVTAPLERQLGHIAGVSEMTSASDLGFTVLSISVSLVAVFLPILLMGGIVGRLFREFAVVLSTAILVSLVVSLTTTPMMCARLLRQQRPEERGTWYRTSEKLFAWLLSSYERSLRGVLRHPGITLIVLLITVAVNIFLFIVVPKGFFPQQDNGTVFGGIQGAQDASFPAMQAATARIDNLAKEDPAVANAIAFTGGNGAANSGFLYLALKPLSERQIGAGQVINRLRPKLGVVRGASVFVQAGQDLRIGGRQSNAQYQYTIQSDNLQDLVKWGPIVLQQMRKLPGF